MLIWIKALLLIPCFSTILFSICAIAAARQFLRLRMPVDPGFHPPVSVLIPLCGAQPDALENFSSFCRQDYPEYQLLFTVRKEQDPAVAAVRRLMQMFPERDIQLVVNPNSVGSNPKVSNLHAAEKQARYAVLAVCDGDIRVEPDYLRRVVQPLKDPGVGAVTCMCRSLSKGWAGTLEALRESTEFGAGVLVAWKTEGIKFGLGSTILARRSVLEKIGGFLSIADYLADDFLLGNRIARAGYSVRLSDVVVEHSLSNCGRPAALIQRQIRWNRGIRVCRPWSYRGLLLTYGVPAALLGLVLGGGSLWAWRVFAVTIGFRLAAAHAVGALLMNDRAARRFLWVVPLQDLVSSALWCAGLVGDTITWRGRYFRLTPEGKLIPRLVRSAAVHPMEVGDSRENAAVASP